MPPLPDASPPAPTGLLRSLFLPCASRHIPNLCPASAPALDLPESETPRPIVHARQMGVAFQSTPSAARHPTLRERPAVPAEHARCIEPCRSVGVCGQPIPAPDRPRQCHIGRRLQWDLSLLLCSF